MSLSIIQNLDEFSPFNDIVRPQHTFLSSRIFDCCFSSIWTSLVTCKGSGSRDYIWSTTMTESVSHPIWSKRIVLSETLSWRPPIAVHDGGRGVLLMKSSTAIGEFLGGSGALNFVDCDTKLWFCFNCMHVCTINKYTEIILNFL